MLACYNVVRSRLLNAMIRVLGIKHNSIICETVYERVFPRLVNTSDSDKIKEYQKKGIEPVAIIEKFAPSNDKMLSITVNQYRTGLDIMYETGRLYTYDVVTGSYSECSELPEDEEWITEAQWNMLQCILQGLSTKQIQQMLITHCLESSDVRFTHTQTYVFETNLEEWLRCLTKRESASKSKQMRTLNIKRI